MVTGLLALLDDCLWGTVWCHFGATIVSKDWQSWGFRVSFDLVPKSRHSRAGHDVCLPIFWSAGILNEKNTGFAWFGEAGAFSLGRRNLLLRQ